MPLYEYSCEDCRTDFEALVRTSDDVVHCPECGGERLIKQISVPAAAKVPNGASTRSADSPIPVLGCGGPACRQGLCGDFG